jgi:hypothetical protein
MTGGKGGGAGNLRSAFGVGNVKYDFMPDISA